MMEVHLNKLDRVIDRSDIDKFKKLYNPAFCPLPFLHLYNNGTGHYYLCCHTSKRNFSKEWNITDHNPYDFFFSEDMDNVRQKMLNGQFVSDCANCYAKDQEGVTSDRIKHIQTFNDKLMTWRNMEIKFSMFGNYCNLSCAMCHPVHSSERVQELQSINETNVHWKWPGKLFRLSNKRYKELKENVLKNIGRISEICFSTDGELLQNARAYEFLYDIPLKDSKEITLSITSNLNEVSFKKHSLDTLIEKFKDVKIRVSADHIYEKYEWVRHKGSFDKLCLNIERYKDYIFHVAPSVSIFNIEDLLEIKSFYENELGVKCFKQAGSYSIVSSPKMLSCSLHKDKELFIDQYKPIDWLSPVVYELKKNINISQKDKLFNYLDRLSVHRGDWRGLWSNL